MKKALVKMVSMLLAVGLLLSVCGTGTVESGPPSMGFHVMLDWVANHTGWDNPWITEHPDWYTQDENGNIVSPDAWAGRTWPT